MNKKIILGAIVLVGIGLFLSFGSYKENSSEEEARKLLANEDATPQDILNTIYSGETSEDMLMALVIAVRWNEKDSSTTTCEEINEKLSQLETTEFEGKEFVQEAIENKHKELNC